MKYMVFEPTDATPHEAKPNEIIGRVAYNFDLSKDDAERMIAQATKDEPLLLYSGEEVWTEE